MSILITPATIDKLSQLTIDADKDWAGKGITNIKQVAAGMALGDVLQHNGSILERLAPGTVHYVLTSAGPLNPVVYAPGGMYYNRYLPANIALSKISGLFIPGEAKSLSLPLATVIRKDGDTLVQRFNPDIALARSGGVFTPDQSSSKNAALNRVLGLTIPLTGAALDDGGVVADYTTQQKSGPVKDQGYTAGEDNEKNIAGGNNWESQTFTTVSAGLFRYVTMKMYRNLGNWPGNTTVSIKATDGNGHPTGADLCSVTFDSSYITDISPGAYYKIVFTTPASRSAATKYAIVVRTAATGLRWRADVTSPGYAGGNREYSSTAGGSWATDTGCDFMFEEYFTTNDVAMLPAAPLQVNDAFYWGFTQPFDAILQDVGIAGAGTYVLAYEYSKGVGVWSNCVDLVDGTNKFQTLYTNEIRHTKQLDWDQDTVSAKLRYWIRARVTDAGAGYSQPLGTFARIYILV